MDTDGFFYFTGSFICIEFDFNLPAAAGRDLPGRKESSCAASTCFDPFNNKLAFPRVPEMKGMLYRSFGFHNTEIMYHFFKDNSRSGITVCYKKNHE